MNLREVEQKNTLRFFLIGLLAFMIFPLGLELFRHDHALLILKIILFIFFVTLYFLNQRTQKTELITHILLLGLYSLLISGLYTTENSDIGSIWFLAIPLFSFLLLNQRQSLIYSALTLSTMYTFFVIYPESASFMEKFRLFIFGLFLTGALYALSRSRNKAWNETEDYMYNLEQKVEEALEQKLEQEKLLIHTSKLATIGEFLSSIVHQWKQPIATISAINVSLRIKEELCENTNTDKLKLNDELEEQTEFMSKTMDDFRSFFKAVDNETAFDLNAASKKLISLFDKSFKAQGININQHESDNIMVFGYSNMYKQALLNLITNAKDVINETKPANTDIDITYDKDDNFGIIRIQDHAGGVPQEILNKIFEKHFTTKKENGSGIGLAMTKEIIEDFCHGKVRVENKDEGAMFSIYIPLQQS